ncbi:hypothetical protein EYF80_047760 [Liparis tanakae]|uniref:Uncharacterized protein n=1 Tax=Liparis tanakae TaxID=230148 RepID=A0A4Z2FLN2_9TELE|nr:hypothetical protein EYF80_047760 [Liparis tanakae]
MSLAQWPGPTCQAKQTGLNKEHKVALRWRLMQFENCRRSSPLEAPFVPLLLALGNGRIHTVLLNSSFQL